MSKTLEGMARLICETDNVEGFKCICPVPFEPDWCLGNRAKKQARAALLWLADNVSDEMVKAFWDQFYSVKVDSPTNKAIAAAIRQAAGGEG